MENFEIPFETRPPRLKDLVSKHIMGDVWIRDTPFGAVTDSLVLAKKFGMMSDRMKVYRGNRSKVYQQ